MSTADQNPQLQIDALLRDGVRPEDIYHEKVSGAAKKRPEFTRMMREIRPGDIVTVWKLDRFGRSTKQVLDTIDKIHKVSADLRIITQHFDSSTPMGKAMLGMCALFSELERDLARERTMAGLASARERGRVGGRRYTYSEKQVEEAAVRFRAGESLSVISRGVRSRTGKAIHPEQLARRIAALEERKAKENAEQQST